MHQSGNHRRSVPAPHDSQKPGAWIPADDDESGTDTPELWDQSIGTDWQAPEIDLGDCRNRVLEYT